MKTTEKTTCWICGRNQTELKKATEAFWESGELGKDIRIDACFEIIKIRKACSKQRMRIPVCIICSQVILEYVLVHLRNEMETVVKMKQPEVSVNL
jgi:hypothetical protein